MHGTKINNATLEFDEGELWNLRCALRDKIESQREWAENHEDSDRVFEMNASKTLRLYIKIAPLVESYIHVKTFLSTLPTEKINFV